MKSIIQFFSTSGRISRLRLFLSLLILSPFVLISREIRFFNSNGETQILLILIYVFVPLLWSIQYVKRLHDTNLRGSWVVLLIPQIFFIASGGFIIEIFDYIAPNRIIIKAIEFYGTLAGTAAIVLHLYPGNIGINKYSDGYAKPKNETETERKARLYDEMNR